MTKGCAQPPPIASTILPLPPQFAQSRPSIVPWPSHFGQMFSPAEGSSGGASSPGAMSSRSSMRDPYSSPRSWAWLSSGPSSFSASAGGTSSAPVSAGGSLPCSSGPGFSCGSFCGNDEDSILLLSVRAVVADSYSLVVRERPTQTAPFQHSRTTNPRARLSSNVSVNPIGGPISEVAL